MEGVQGLRRGLGLALVGIALTAPCADAANSAPSFVPAGKAFGFNGNLEPAGEPLGSTQAVNAAQAGGATHVRMGIQWRSFQAETSYASPVPPSFSTPVGEPTGSWETDRVDRLYLSIVNRGMTPVMVVQNAPAWASTFHKCLTDPVAQLDAKKCPKDWRTKAHILYVAIDRRHALWEFARAVALRYPEAVIEGTNEPDFSKQFQPQFHPPVSVVAEGQCALADGVRAADPNRTILSSSFFLMDYAREWATANAGRNCYTYFNVHLFGSVEVRPGQASSLEGQLMTVRSVLSSVGHTRGFWLTETGLSDTVGIPDEDFNADAAVTGEPLVARAFPKWMKYLFSQSDVHGALVHTILEGSYRESGDLFGFGLLKSGYVVKEPGDGSLPRFCFLVLSAGNSYPGCDGYTLPGPEAPSAPSFYKAPQLLWEQTTTGIGDEPRVLFLEQGSPQPHVEVTWLRCDAAGLSCTPFNWGRSSYKLAEKDRLKRIKVRVYLANEHGTVTKETKLSPIVGS